MKRLFTALACIVVGFISFQSIAAERGTEAEAEALVKKAIAYYKKNGKEKSMDEFSKSPGPFVDRDLYVTVLTLQGDSLAHINPQMRGKNTLDYRDMDGKYPIRERTELAKKDGKGWQEFKFFNPMTKEMEIKRTYFEKYDNLIFSSGAFRPR
jgi:signal transduction histidine kinase